MNSPNSAARNRRILIIDDNPAIHEDFRKILVSESLTSDPLADLEAVFFERLDDQADRTVFNVDSAFQGQEGLKKVREALAIGQPYAMAFVDMRMPPGWDGVETIAQIWSADIRLQVVICTAYSDHSWEEIIRKLGNRNNLAVLKKPFDNIEVLQLAETLTQKWFLMDQIQNQV